MRLRLSAVVLLFCATLGVSAQTEGMRIWHFDKGKGCWVDTDNTDTCSTENIYGSEKKTTFPITRNKKNPFVMRSLCDTIPSVNTHEKPFLPWDGRLVPLNFSGTILPDTLYKPLSPGDTIYHVYLQQPDTVKVVEYCDKADGDYNNPFLHLKAHNNLAYDAALALNGGLEMSFGKKWSVGVDAWVTWLRWTKHNDWYESYGFDLYGRYWFGKSNTQPFTGYHIGIYAGTLTYDIFPGSKGYQCDDMFQTLHAGVEFGYSQYLTKRNKNWRVDFYGGIGFLHTKQDVYHDNFGGGYYVSKTRRRNLPEFTRFGVTIGYMFGQKKK